MQQNFKSLIFLFYSLINSSIKLKKVRLLYLQPKANTNLLKTSQKSRNDYALIIT